MLAYELFQQTRIKIIINLKPCFLPPEVQIVAISGSLAAMIVAVCLLFGAELVVYSGFFTENSCLLLPETGLLRAVRVTPKQ